MSITKGFSEIVTSMIDRLNISQPNLDTKPGTVARDLFIDLQADQLARFYSVLNLISQKQSLATTSGQDLDLLASNFGLARKTGTPASGYVLLTLQNLTSDILVQSGTVITARNGFSYRTLSSTSISVSDKGRLASIASKLKKALNNAGITASYAVEVAVECTRIGESGNISPLQISTIDIELNGIVATNLASFTGGSSRESDDAFRARILSIFSGANIGTAAGYRNAALSVDGVTDALIVEPGSSLMTRDGTEVINTADGLRIISSGTGGKVDLYILGSKLQNVTESYIYNDLSGVGDPTDEVNYFILGQASIDQTRTLEEKRLIALKTNKLPMQPVADITSVVGSISGDLTKQYIDASGQLQGNYKLLKDEESDSAGSPFGFDKLVFTSTKKLVNGEIITKGLYNGSDSLLSAYTTGVTSLYTDIQESSELAQLSKSTRDLLYLPHKNIVKINKIQNITTGEQYSPVSFSAQTGEVTFSAKSYPSLSETVLVTYVWRKSYLPDIEYYDIEKTNLSNINWSISNIITEELTIDAEDDEFFITTTYNPTLINSVYLMSTAEGNLRTFDISGETVIGITIDEAVNNVISIIRTSDNAELYLSNNNTGRISSTNIYLPEDSMGAVGDSVIVKYNKIELYTFNGSNGFFSNAGKKISLASQNILEAEGILESIQLANTNNYSVFVNYAIDKINLIDSVDLNLLPALSIAGSNSLQLSAAATSNNLQPILYNFSGSIPTDVIKFSPSQLSITTTGLVSAGKLRIYGKSFNRLSAIVQGTYISGRKVSLLNILGSKKIGILHSIEINGVTYNDIYGYSLLNNIYDTKSAKIDNSLKAYEIVIPENITFTSGTELKLNLTVINESDEEDIYFRTSGTKISENYYGEVYKISIINGFKNSQNLLRGSLTIEQFNQPITGTSYFANYYFTSPVQGERIFVNYTINKTILDVTKQIELLARPITADVLVKEAYSLAVDVTGTILISEDFISESSSIQQSVVSAITGLLNTNKLGSRVDYSDAVSIAATVRGVDSVNISLFNESGKIGRRSFISALENQTIIAGTVKITVVTKDKFKIN